MARGFPVLLLAAVAVVWSCGDRPGDADGDVDGDSDGDTDGDTDCDADPFCGSDADIPPPHGDAGPDADADAEQDGLIAALRAEALCLDGTEETRASFSDCEALGCLSSPGCCVDVGRSWIQGDFSACTNPLECGWTAFPAGEAGYESVPPWIELVAVESGGESGLYTDAVVEAVGGPTLSFAASLDPAGCPAAGCRQLVGVALTAQDQISGATGIEPVVAIVLDGEHGTVRYMVDGQIEPDSTEAPFEELIATRGYALRLRGDGRLEFWSGLAVDPSAATPVELVGEPSFVSSRALDVGGARLRVALFGQLSGEGRGRVGALRLERPICDVPDGFVRDEAPALLPSGSVDRVGGPAVIASPQGGLLMVYEAGDHLVAAESASGDAWTPGPVVLPSTAPTQYGRVARRAPTLLYLGADSFWPGYHLWFEAESEYPGTLANGQPRFAIVHATSTNGTDWSEEAEEASIALVGSAERQWMSEVGQPSVVQLPDESLVMFFTGTSGLTGETLIGQASSFDGRSWVVSDAPLALWADGLAQFERDGVSHPAALRRGAEIHLWYTGADGVRESIGYAVGSIESGHLVALERFGRVLEPRSIWEGERVRAPVAAVLPPFGATEPAELAVGELRIWYEAGMPGRERIGAAIREVPARIDEEG